MRCQNTTIFHVVVFLTLGSLTLLGGHGHAQVISSVTASGLDTTVTQNGPIYNITGGTRPGNGPNLFHSFGEFSVGALDTARFLNTTPELATSNILGRVTGSNPSSLFGAIDSMSYPGANLFRLNVDWNG